jgi:hypothetical protein
MFSGSFLEEKSRAMFSNGVVGNSKVPQENYFTI